MFNVGVGELFVILVLALLVFGPQKLPEIARNLGKAFRMFQQETEKATRTFRTAFEETTPAAGVIDHPDDPAPLAEPAPEGTGPDPAPAAEPEPPAEVLDPAVRLMEDT